MVSKFFFVCSTFLFLQITGFAQLKADSLITPPKSAYQLSYKKFILPAALISFGFITKEKCLNGCNNTSIYDEPKASFSTFFKPVNIARFAPAALVYSLNLTGVKGEHNIRDRSIIYFTAQAITSVLVYSLKHSIKEMRPDSSNFLSFPSGHAALSFSAAHFFYREYQNNNFWLAISTFPIALFTAANRMANNKHWFGDVCAGAGIGILSTEAAYWLFPKINKALKKNKRKTQAMVLPYYQSNSYGLSAMLQF